MAQWHLAFDGRSFGPMDRARAQTLAQEQPDAYAWRDGFAQWRPVADVAELAGPQVPNPRDLPPPPMMADEVDFEIRGAEMQYVEVELDPGESAVAEAGSMMYKDPGIAMSTVFGDGSGQDAGFMGALIGAGKRVLTGKGMFTTVFTHEGQGKARLAFAAPYPGHLIPIALPQVGGTLMCQKDAFLCAAKGVAIGLYFQKRMMTGLFGGEGFIMQRLDGDGMVFLHAGGTVVERTLGVGEELHVDTGCLVAMVDSVKFDVEYVGGVRSALVGGEGLFFARVRGPGRIWLQSLPMSRLAGRMLMGAGTRR